MRVPKGVLIRLSAQSSEALDLCIALGADATALTNKVESVSMLKRRIASLNLQLLKLRWYDSTFSSQDFRSGFNAQVTADLQEKRITDLGQSFNWSYLALVTNPYVREAMCRELVDLAQSSGVEPASLWLAFIDSEGTLNSELEAKFKPKSSDLSADIELD